MLKLWTTTITTISLVLFSLNVHADELPEMTDMSKGQKAPFSGTLFNVPAIAQIITETENSKQQCALQKNYIESREKAKCDLTVSNVQASLSVLQQKYNSILDIKNEEIERLNKIALDRPNKNSHWWFAGGTAVGIVTSVVIFYAAVETIK